MSFINWTLEVIHALNMALAFLFIQVVIFYLFDEPKFRSKKNYSLLGLYCGIFGYFLSNFLYYSLTSYSDLGSAIYIIVGVLATLSLIFALIFLFLFVILGIDNPHSNIVSILVISTFLAVGFFAIVEYATTWSEDWIFIYSNFKSIWLTVLFLLAEFLTIFLVIAIIPRKFRSYFFPEDIQLLIDRKYLGIFCMGISFGGISEFLNSIGSHSYLILVGSSVSTIGLTLTFLIIFYTRKDLKNVEREIIENQLAEFKELDILKDLFVDSTSHELRTPLTIIRGHLEMLQTRDGGKMLNPEQRQKSYEAISRNYKLMKRLIDDINDVSRIKRGIIGFNFTETCLVGLIQRTVEDMRDLVEGRGLTISFFKESECLNAYFDADRISQVIRNLIENAVKFTHQGGITVILEERTLENFISITDTGKGIDPKELHLVFNQFKFRSKSSMVSDGLGLGLFISKNIVESHNGKIWVESEGKDKGCSFNFTLSKAMV